MLLAQMHRDGLRAEPLVYAHSHLKHIKKVSKQKQKDGNLIISLVPNTLR